MMKKFNNRIINSLKYKKEMSHFLFDLENSLKLKKKIQNLLSLLVKKDRNVTNRKDSKNRNNFLRVVLFHNMIANDL